MKVIKAFGPKDLRLVEVPEPVPGNGEVLIAVRASGICGSDKWFWRVSGPVDAVAGHEVAGEVVKLGPGVKKLKMGDRVAVNNVVGCGHCHACRSGEFVRCPNRPGKDVNNGFSEYVVAPERNCLLLDDRIDYETGCLIFDNWGTPFGAVSRADISVGHDVLIFGCGPIGLAAVALAKERGAYVIAVDPQPYRLNAARQIGADEILTPDDALPDKVRQITSGLGVDVVLECSGKAPAYQLGLASLKIGGTLVSVGEGACVDFRPSDFVIRNHLNIFGTWYSTMYQGRMVQNLILEGKIKPKAFLTHRISLEEVPHFFGKVCDFEDNILKAVIVIPEK